MWRCSRLGYSPYFARVLCLALAAVFLSGPALAQKYLDWRIFKPGESPAAWISYSPRGNIWVKHGDEPALSWFDGYSQGVLSIPETNTFRAYEGRSGQVWTLYPEGLLLWDRGSWHRFPNAEIQGEFQKNPLRQLRQIPLLPAEANHVFFLLGDAFMEFDARAERSTVVKAAAAGKIGSFIEMQESPSGSVWVSGAKGLAHVPGPARRITRATAWEEFPIPDELGVEKVQRPFEDIDGNVLASVEQRRENAPRVIARLSKGKWSIIPVRGEKVRQVWGAWDESVWGFTYNSLVKIEPGSGRDPLREGVPGSQYDVCRETNGVFWLGCSEGVVRYTPFLWQTPTALRGYSSPFHAILASPEEDGIWAAGTEGLLHVAGQSFRAFRWPEDYETYFRASDQIYRLPNGRLVVSSLAKPLLFDPATTNFSPLPHPGSAPFRFVGQFRNGDLCARVADPSNPGLFRLEAFNGERFSLYREAPPGGWRLGPELYAMLQTQAGDVWLGGSAGVGRLSGGASAYETFGPESGFAPERAFCLLEVPDNRIWCGGTDRVLQFTGSKWQVVFSGMDRVNGFSRGRDGRVWISANNGLYRFNNGICFANDTQEGLPAATVYNAVEDRSGRIWAATSRGISVFHPEADQDPPRALEPLVENADRAASEEGPAIAFRGVDRWEYTPASLLLFSYRLDAGAWSPYTNRPPGVFRGLGPGKHRVDVRCLDRNGNEDSIGAGVEFAIILPWFRDPRLLAVSLCLFFVILGLAALAVNRHLQLRRSYAEVERIVDQRTRQLEEANQELLHSQKMRALGTLAAGVAHDFNNILSVIKGSAQIIETHVDDPEKIKTRVARIKTVVEQGAGIVRSMLGLGRWSEKDLEECDLPELVLETARLWADRFSHEVAIRVERTEPLPPLFCSREVLQQMLLNLVLNAVEAMGGRGEVVLRVGLLERQPAKCALAPDAAAQYALIAVSDSGPGIPAEILPRIFEPFFTTKALSTKRGTGLGLSMVYELAKGMGYGLAVDSPPGHGAIFSIVLPISRRPGAPHFV